jgi:integrase
VRPSTLRAYRGYINQHLIPRLGKRKLAALTARDVLVLLLTLGLRRSELLGLTWADVDLTGKTLTVRQGVHRTPEGLVVLPPKSRRSRRTVPLVGLALKALKEHRTKQRKEGITATVAVTEGGPVFTSSTGTWIDPRNFSRIFTRWCTAAGVTMKLHDTRHTTVSLLLSLGVHPRVVMEIVGHFTMEMTMNVYGHVSLDAQREALGKLDGLMDP